MGICTSCGYLSDENEAHECSPAHILIGKKARQVAQDALVFDGVLVMDGAEISVVEIPMKELK